MISLQEQDPQALPGTIAPNHTVNGKIRAVTDWELRREGNELIDRNYVRRQAIHARSKCISDTITARIRPDARTVILATEISRTTNCPCCVEDRSIVSVCPPQKW
jgi:hypothetical protein